MLFALSLHEASHAYSAYLMGDDTAALQGRVTLNPIHHIDPIGLIAFFVFHFGWAKPVPVNPYRLRNPGRDDMLVSLAGPGSNLVLGLLILLLIRLLWTFWGPQTETGRTLIAFLFVGAQLNVGLCFFNLIPIRPLDGSHILMGLLPDRLAQRLEPVMAQGHFLLLGLIVLSFIGVPVFAFLVWAPMQLLMRSVLGNQVFFEAARALSNFLI